jgi:hypothetical protein
MKKLLLVAACIVASVGALAQGTILFNNVSAGAVAGKITDSDGTTGLAGAAFMAQLYAGADANSLAPVGVALTFRTGAAAGFVDTTSGDATVAIPGVASGTVANVLQVRAWAASGGSTYAAAVAAGAHAGESAIFASGGPLGGGGSPPATPASLANFKGFSLAFTAVPEPSTIALGVLGVAGLLMRRRN